MKRRRKILAFVIAGLVALYGATAVALFLSLPLPHRQFDYMVIGTGSIGITIFALFAGYAVRSRL
jgi:hypothetical protein